MFITGSLRGKARLSNRYRSPDRFIFMEREVWVFGFSGRAEGEKGRGGDKEKALRCLPLTNTFLSPCLPLSPSPPLSSRMHAA
jgi:hypothetical protein